MPLSETSISRTGSNILLSRTISRLLLGGFFLVLLVVAGAAYLMAAEQNRLAREKTEALITAGVGGIEEQIDILVLDYSNWTPMYEAVARQDKEWLYDNSGFAAVADEYMDLIVIVEPDRVTNYGWIHGGDETPKADLVPPDLLAQMNALLDTTQLDGQTAVGAYAEIDGQLWYLTATRITVSRGTFAEGGLFPAHEDRLLARHVFGLRITDEVLADLGDRLLVDDVSVVRTRPAEGERIVLRSPVGDPVAYVTWTPPQPGYASMMAAGLPVLAVMAFLGAITMIAGRTMVSSAQRLERALGAADAASQAKSDFLANMSHELRTPMNGVIGVAQILARSDLGDEQRRMVQIIANSAEQQMQIVKDLMDISRIEAGRAVLDLAPFRPLEVLEEVCDMMRIEADRKEIDFAFDRSEASAGEVLGDHQAFRQIALNIIGNAIKFTDQGGVRVEVATATRADETRLTLHVRDTGPGIPAEAQRMIFERFSQIDASLTRGKGGSGLGLAISQSLAQMMGGAISVQSAPGQGADFTLDVGFELPERALGRAA